MAHHDPSSSQRSEDWLANIVEWISDKFLWIGIGLTAISTAALMFYAFKFSGGASFEAELQRGAEAISMFQKLMVSGVIVLALGMTARFWGDIALPITLFVLAAILFTATWWMVLLVGEGGSAENIAVSGGAIGSISLSGIILGVYAVLLQIVDAYVRVKFRAEHGSKGDFVKYGKDAGEESVYQNRFMGKCWQLPFCRKFVRERCPIYHARRTCWRERVGCMCEEEVIRGAMDNKVIPKDVVAAARMIPYNLKIPLKHKAERCRQCVIYNEHQRHKYRLMVPMVFVVVGLFYFALHNELLVSVSGLVQSFDKSMSQFTLAAADELANRVDVVSKSGPGILEEILLFCIMMFVLSQLLKLVEFLIFKLKV